MDKHSSLGIGFPPVPRPSGSGPESPTIALPAVGSALQASLDRLRDSHVPSHLPLSHPWSFFFSDTSAARRAHHSYSSAINQLITCDTVPILCASANGLCLPNAFAHLRVNQNLHFFRSSVTPEWEHPWNEKGGRFTLTPPASQISGVFLTLVLLLAGSSIELDVDAQTAGGTLLGVVAARRGRGDRIEIWVGGTAPGSRPEQKWLEALRAVLINELPGVEIPKYKQHF